MGQFSAYPSKLQTEVPSDSTKDLETPSPEAEDLQIILAEMTEALRTLSDDQVRKLKESIKGLDSPDELFNMTLEMLIHARSNALYSSPRTPHD